jgi:hypothetical protein
MIGDRKPEWLPLVVRGAEVKSVLGCLQGDKRLTMYGAGLRLKDPPDGRRRVQVPDALDRKHPDAATDWRWQWVFPRSTAGPTPRPESKGGITSMNPFCRRPWLRPFGRRIDQAGDL